ncbi:hypothetical protein TAMA11512_19630 [Selenomonas sp. TAMA-11512]|uniref:LPS export ABC transporter periplasmic protein LptC n=1 Tax=Selenomonas sp. TAMA-11512 TaxID=3095337 RepID=UPI00308484E4|nr:hypothetical protein TAMA11512_19630 [Selenomonas sp. TAMA-11512]
MSKQGKILALLGGVLFLGVLLWAVFSVPEPPDEGAARADRIMHYDTNTIHAEKDGKTTWHLVAKDMEMDIDTNDATFGEIEGVFYGEEGKELHLKAPSGSYNAKTHNLHLEGGITVESSDGMHLTSEGLDWNETESLLAAVGNAQLVHAEKDLIATGDRIESRDAFTKFAAKGNGDTKAEIRKGSAGN